MKLKDYTTEELSAELKKRNAEERAKKASVLRCRMCKHWGAIDYWAILKIILMGEINLANSLK